VTAQLVVRLTPRGGRDGIDGVGDDGVLRVRVAAAPVDGAANEAMVRLLAHELGVARGAVHLVGGETARTKRVAIDGIDAVALEQRWPGLAAR
jgi:uncharacterized protein YggU (UPF0235/DUF167 family)